jgi:cullin 3
MVSAKQGRTLYEGTKTIIVENLDRLAKTHIVPTFPVGTEEDTVQDCTQGEQLLKAFRFVWDDHISSMTKLRDILKYMVCRDTVPLEAND